MSDSAFLSRKAFVAASGAALAASQMPPAASAKDADVSELYEAAKKEGSVTWWGAPYAQEVAVGVRDAFVKKYPGIRVNFIRQTANVIFERAMRDIQSGVKEVDVFNSTDELHYVVLNKHKALASFRPPDIGAVPKAFQSMGPHDTYQLGALGFVIINYNTKAVKEPPKRWTDLLESRWQNAITTGDPSFSGYVGNWVLAMNDKYGWDYFTKFAKNDPKINRSVFDTVTDIVAGDRTVGAGPENYTFANKARGNPVDVQFPLDDAVIIVSPVAVMSAAPHPNAARLFENFFYSREYSETMTKFFNFPLRSDVPSFNGMHLRDIKYYRNTVDRLLTKIPEIIKKWQQTFGV